MVLGLLGVVAAVALVAVLRLTRVADDLRDAQALLDAAAVAIEDGRLAEAQDGLREAQQILTVANDQLYTSLELELGGNLPVLKQNLAAVKDGVSVASTLVNGGILILRDAAPLQSEDGTLEVPLSDGALPLEAIADTRSQLSLLGSSLPDTSEAPSDRWVIGTISDAQRDVYAEANRRRAQIEVLTRGLDVVGDMAGGGGERTYLIAVANTAEMRGSGGMILNYGVLTGEDGDFELARFGRIDELLLPGPVDLPPDLLPDDLLARWDGFGITELWRNATVAADFEVTAPLLEAMYAERTGTKPSGVIQIDPHGLAAVLKGIGPVAVPGLGTVDADNVVPFTLNEAYRRFPGIEERSDVLGDIAEATFRRLVDGEYDSLRPLATALVRSVEQRHIVVHSTSVETQRRFDYFGATGALPPTDLLDNVHLTVQNVSGNKLDYYLDTSLSITGERMAGEIGTLRAEIELTNTAPPGATEPSYVFGPFDERQVAGQYRGLVTLYLPAGTTLVGTSGDPPTNPPIAQTEAGRPLVSYTIAVPAGETRRVVLDLALAPLSQDAAYGLLAVPSPRVRPTAIEVDIANDAGRVRGSASLRTPLWFLPDRAPARGRPDGSGIVSQGSSR